MGFKLSQPNNINVLITNTHWAWPQAVTEIFRPRHINALIGNSSEELVQIVTNSKIHLAIVDACLRGHSTLDIIKVLRNRNQLLPFILLAHPIDDRLLTEALHLGVFSVLDKPVNLSMLAEQIDRIFRKCYGSSFPH